MTLVFFGFEDGELQDVEGPLRMPAIEDPIDADQDEVARELAKYDFLAIPVIDHAGHLVGIVTHDANLLVVYPGRERVQPKS